MRRAGALVAALVATVLALLTAPGAAALPRPGAAGLVLELAELSPRVVTEDGPSVLTVTGTLRNTGAVEIRDIGVRLQRGQPLRGEAAVRDALAGDAATDATAPQFQELPDALRPGDDAPVRLTVPLRGAPETSLALSAAGVYELLVNVNGAPADGDRARLAAVRMLLPVLGLPAGPDGSDPVPARTAAAVPATVLYPLADQPRRLTTVGAPALLSDDALAASFAPDGRLGGLVAALAGAPDTARDAVCTAVDPDLLQTADAMRGGYEVQRPDGSRVPGAGADAAGRWLDGLVAAVAGRCVVALPFADADLVALTRAGLGPAAADAVTAGRTIAEDVLGTPVLDATTWPDDGLLDDATLEVLAAAGTSGVVLAADGVDEPAAGGTVALTGPDGVRAAIADTLLTDAADTPEDAPADAGPGRAARAAPAGGSLATQDLLGALAFRTGTGPGPLLLAPPHRWDVDGAAASALLDGVARLVDAGALAPRDLSGGLPAPSGAERDLEYPLEAGAAEVAPDAATALRRVLADLDDLRSSAVDDEQGADPDELFAILRLGAVRAVSAAWRDRPADATTAATTTSERAAAIRSSVAVLEPPTPFSLGTSDSPLLLTVANGLPVTMRVRVELASTSGLRVAPIPPVEVPPLGRVQVQANAEVLRSGVFTVDAAVLSEDGGRLGPPSRLQVRSTAYGTITLWLTGTAGVLLVVLAGRRILRRIRSEPGRATEAAPPGPVPEPTTPSRPPGDSGPGAPEGPTLPVRMAAASSAPNRPGPPTGPTPPAPSGPGSAPGAPPLAGRAPTAGGPLPGTPTGPTPPRRPESR